VTPPLPWALRTRSIATHQQRLNNFSSRVVVGFLLSISDQLVLPLLAFGSRYRSIKNQIQKDEHNQRNCRPAHKEKPPLP